MPLTDVDQSGFDWHKHPHTKILLSARIRALKPAHKGMLWMLMEHAALEVPFASLPSDAERLAEMAGVALPVWSKAADAVLGAAFVLCSDNRWYCQLLTDALPQHKQPEQESKPSNAKKPVNPDISNKRSAAAKARWGSENAKQNANADAQPMQNMQNQNLHDAKQMQNADLHDANAMQKHANEGDIGGDLDLDQEKDLEKNTQEPSCATAGKASAVDSMFAVFWAAYPRKIGKKDALKAFQKIKPNDDLLQTMLDAVAKQSKSHDWLKEGGRFVPHPTTWLRGERWSDDVQQLEKAPQPPVAQRPLNPHSQIRANRAAAMNALNEPSILDVTPTTGGQS